MIKDNPVPETHRAALFELLSWLYGKNSVIKSQGVDRPRLQRVLASEDGLRELRTTGDLDAAESVAGLRSEDWLGLLAKVAAMTTKATSEAAIVVTELPPEVSAQAQGLLKRIETHIRQIKSVFTAEV